MGTISQVTWNFKGKPVLVTGGAAGIGLAIGTEFVRAGARVAFLDRDKAALEKAVEAASTAGPGEALSVVCDLTNSQEIIRAVQDVTEPLGNVDILANNAGVGAARPLVALGDQ